MRRIHIPPRPNWQRKVERVGLVFHTANGIPYWDESAFYQFTSEEVNELEKATNELQEMCLKAVQHVIDQKRFDELGIPKRAIPLIVDAWENEPPSIYGRFDLCYTGYGPPKLLEYNADTPTSLLEAAVAQWYWLQDFRPQADQFNSIHERLLAKWKELTSYVSSPVIHFASLEVPEDIMTVTYLEETARLAGFRTSRLEMKDIGWDSEERCFVDLNGMRISTIFKLYPWEWMINEEYGSYLMETRTSTQWIEPAWKTILSNKGILAILWELFPRHPYLLETYTGDPRSMRSYAKKPLLSREGANVAIYKGGRSIEEVGGDYGEEGHVFQALADLPNHDGNHPVIGSWVIDGEAAGIGIRESRNLITNNFSRFVPHLLE